MASNFKGNLLKVFKKDLLDDYEILDITRSDLSNFGIPTMAAMPSKDMKKLGFKIKSKDGSFEKIIDYKNVDEELVIELNDLFKDYLPGGSEDQFIIKD